MSFVFQQLLELFIRIPADIPHAYTTLLGDVAQLFREFAPTLFGKRRDRNPNQLAVIRRIEAQICITNRFLYGAYSGRIPGLNRDHRWFRNVQLRHLVERRRRTVVIHPDAVQNADRSASGSNGRHFVLEIDQHLFHTRTSVGFYFLHVLERTEPQQERLLIRVS